MLSLDPYLTKGGRIYAKARQLLRLTQPLTIQRLGCRITTNPLTDTDGEQRACRHQD